MRLSIVHLILSLSAATATTAAAAAGVRRTETDTTKLEAELATVEELEAETEQLITELERTDGTTLGGGDGITVEPIVAPQIEPYPLPYEEEPILCTDSCPEGQVLFPLDATRTQCKCIDEPIEYVECNSFTDLTDPCPDGQVIFSLDDTRTKCKCIDHVKVPCENITCTEPGYKVEEFYHTEITSENSTTTCKRSCVPICTEDKMECHGEILIRDPLLNCEFPKCPEILDKSPSSQPSSSPSSTPSLAPTESPSSERSSDPSSQPSRQPSPGPTKKPRGGGGGNGGNGGGGRGGGGGGGGKKGGKKRNLRAAA